MKKFALAIIVLASCSSNESVMLKVNPKLQHMNSWCWAATVAMANEYFTGRSTQDCDVANTYFESQGQNKCCPFNIKCNRGLKPSHLLYLIETQMKLAVEIRTKALRFEEIVDAISSNKLILVGLSTNGELQETHLVLINGYAKDGEYIHLIDPGTGSICA